MHEGDERTSPRCDFRVQVGAWSVAPRTPPLAKVFPHLWCLPWQKTTTAPLVLTPLA